jgi:diguanylate cyclase (GGDEF)-like protein
MNNIAETIAEVAILVFNILIFMELTELKKDNFASKSIMYTGSVLILGTFFFVASTGVLPEVAASFVCVTIPTTILFWSLSKYKDSRFFVTFCFLDTVTLILGFFGRSAGIAFGHIAGVIVSALVCVIMLTVYIKGKNLFKTYRYLMRNVNDGWFSMAVTVFLVYILLVFAASYPKPLIERTEYLLPYGLLSITILAFYWVFIQSLLQRKNLADINVRLTEEQEWHRNAYLDALTGLKNRMAYMDMCKNLAQIQNNTDVIYTIMLDTNNFKKVNDTYGHHRGDEILKDVAKALSETFAGNDYMVFRIGGDEFAVISLNADEAVLKEKVETISKVCFEETANCTLAVGISRVDFSEENAVEKAFIRADREMYDKKLGLKRVLN